MTRNEADDAIEAKLERVGNARNLINPDILRAMLAGIGLVIVPREPDLRMLRVGPEHDLGWHPNINESVRQNVWERMIETALADEPASVD